MKVATCLLISFCVSQFLLAQGTGHSSDPATEAFPKPSFVLHDAKRKVEKPRAVFGPMQSDGKGHTTGSIAFYGGSSLIQVSSLAFSADGRLLAVGSTPGIVDVWNIDTRKIVRSFVGGTSVALSPDGRWLAKDGKGIEVVDVSSGKTRISIPWKGEMIRRLSFDPNGTLLLVSSNGEDDRVFELTTGHLVAELTNTQSAHFSLDGALAVGGDYKHLMIWVQRPGHRSTTFRMVQNYVTAIAVSPRSDLMIDGGPKTSRLRRMDTGADVTQIRGGYTSFAGFNKNGSAIFLQTAAGFNILNTEGTVTCSGLLSNNGTVAISQDGRWIAAGILRGLTDVEVWSVNSLVWCPRNTFA